MRRAQVVEAPGLEDATRQLAAEMLVTLCEAREKAPGMMRKLPQFIGRLFQSLLAFLLDIEARARAPWPGPARLRRRGVRRAACSGAGRGEHSATWRTVCQSHGRDPGSSRVASMEGGCSSGRAAGSCRPLLCTEGCG